MENNYKLPVGNEDRKRLEAQNISYQCANDVLIKVLTELPEDCHVADLGCGTGAMIRLMHENLLNKGHILYAIDSSSKQLDICRSGLSDIDNIEFVKFDFQGSGNLELNLDLSYMRLVLMHLKDPSSALEKVINATKKGGYILLVDCINSQHWCEPESNTFDLLFKYYMRKCIKDGIDYDYGKKLGALVKSDSRIELVSISSNQPVVNLPESKESLFFAFENMKSFFANEGMVNKEINHLRAELKNLVMDHSVYFGFPPLVTALCKVV